MDIDLHFTERDWERIERDWTSWWSGELTRPMVMIENSRTAVSREWSREFLLEDTIDAVLDHFQAKLEGMRFYGDSWPKWWPNFGAGIIAGFLGSRVHCTPDTRTIWFEPAESGERNTPELAEIKPAYNGSNIWQRRVYDLTRAAVERWGDRVAVAHTDLGGNLDVIASLRSTHGLLLDLHDAPGEVARLASEITGLWQRYYDELYAVIKQAGRGTTPWAAVWSPGRCYMLQCDFSYMISPQMFERFVMPDIAACCDVLDHAFYHLDGIGQIRHLDMLLSLKRLHGVQWVPGDGQRPPEGWLPLLKRIRDGGKLCQLYVSPEGARKIVRELGGRGFALFISQAMDQAEAKDFLRVLSAEDAGNGA